MNIEEFDYSVDILAVVLWQYNEATNLLSLLNSKQEWYNLFQTDFWTNWYTEVFNLSAPNSGITLFGLAVWSIILDLPLFVPLVPVGDTVVWGFNGYVTQSGVLNSTTTVTGLTNATTTFYVGMGVSGADIPSSTTIASITNNTTIVLSLAATASTTETLTFSPENQYLNFNNAPFALSYPIITLSEPQQQFVLLLKYFNCTNRGTISWPVGFPDQIWKPGETVYTNNFVYNINSYLQYLLFYMGDAIGYPSGNIFCIDNLNMTITYTFSGSFPANLFLAIKTLDLLPRPAGVTCTNY